MNKKLQSTIKFSFLFLLGGSIYYCLEIFARGHSHYSMFFAGGLSLAFIDFICNNCSIFKNKKIFIKAIIGGLIITSIELIIGVVFNMIFKMNVWDYSSVPLNLLGQICLPFTALWIILSFPALLICNLMERIFKYPIFKNNKPKI
ncbi:MAG: hypothetical protein E7614_00380 [Ruminococcaceae bacterium]|nr:hypothetical protein [Oscillospiraceae bacterium]